MKNGRRPQKNEKMEDMDIHHAVWFKCKQIRPNPRFNFKFMKENKCFFPIYWNSLNVDSDLNSNIYTSSFICKLSL